MGPSITPLLETAMRKMLETTRLKRIAELFVFGVAFSKFGA